MKAQFLLCLLFGAVAQALLIIPTKPSEDDFYNAPEGFEDKEDGTILKWRKAPGSIGPIVRPIDIDSAWQALYKTTDALGNPIATVTTILKPHNADSKKVVSYQSMEDSASIDCAPSYSFLWGSDISTIGLQVEIFIVQILLDNGYYVVTPDYEGPEGAFTVGRLAGKAVLDSVRATINSANTTGIDSDASFALFGYSGGSLASGWAAALQPDYAPELKDKILGAAVGGFVTNITATVEAVNGGILAGLGSNGVLGLAKQYPDVLEYFAANMEEGRYEDILEADDQCLVGSVLKYPFTNFFEGDDRYFTAGWDALSSEPIRTRIEENTLAISEDSEIPQIPLFIFHGLIDSIVPFVGAQRAYENWCEWSDDISIEFAVDQTTGHLTELFEGIPAALAWVKKLFAQEGIVSGCQRTERLSNLLYPEADQSVYEFLQATFKGIIGADLGPNFEGLVL